MPSTRNTVESYAPTTYLLYEHRISAQKIADHRDPKRSGSAVGFEMRGERPLTEETLDAIFKVSGGNAELVAEIRRMARELFVEKNPQRPHRHAFKPAQVTL